MRIPFVLALTLLVTACTQFPEVDAATEGADKHADYPTLVPIENVLGGPETRLDENSEAALEARISRLKRRAAELAAREVD